MTVRRFVPLVLTLAMALAPVVLIACDAMCADHREALALSTHSGHDHHSSGAPAAPADSHYSHHGSSQALVEADLQVGQVGSPRCAHGDDLPELVTASHHVAMTPVTTSTLIDVPHTTAVGLLVDAGPLIRSSRTALTTQLRL